MLYRMVHSMQTDIHARFRDRRIRIPCRILPSQISIISKTPIKKNYLNVSNYVSNTHYVKTQKSIWAF
jgi:hypothetical protein